MIDDKQIKMTANDTIISMLSGIINNKTDLVYKAAETYLTTLPQSGTIAYRIKRILSERPLRFMRLDNLDASIKTMLNTPVLSDENVYLNDPIRDLIRKLKTEWENLDAFNYHNIPVRNKILLHGPTGNGKTTIARFVAKQMSLPFVEVKSDLVIDSRMGSSGENIHKIFNKIKEPCILFWDEVDTVGRKRGVSNDSAASMENDRIVNSILVNLEKLGSETVFIAATNRYDILDSAFIRRFDVLFEIPHPTDVEKEAFTKQLLNYHRLAIDVGVSTFTNFSDIKRYVMDIARNHIISKIVLDNET